MRGSISSWGALPARSQRAVSRRVRGTARRHRGRLAERVGGHRLRVLIDGRLRGHRLPVVDGRLRTLPLDQQRLHRLRLIVGSDDEVLVDVERRGPGQVLLVSVVVHGKILYLLVVGDHRRLLLHDRRVLLHEGRVLLVRRRDGHVRGRVARHHQGLSHLAALDVLLLALLDGSGRSDGLRRRAERDLLVGAHVGDQRAQLAVELRPVHDERPAVR